MNTEHPNDNKWHLFDVTKKSSLIGDLAVVEIHALTEAAYHKMDLDLCLETIGEDSHKAGRVLFLISLFETYLPPKALSVFNFIVANFEMIPLLEGGFYSAQLHLLGIKESLAEAKLKHENCSAIAKLDKEISDVAELIFEELAQHPQILNYSELLNLSKNTLENLVRFEKATAKRSKLLDRDDYSHYHSDGHTGGHHTDCLELYANALQGIKNPLTGLVFMDEEGQLNYDLKGEIAKHILK